MADSYGFVHVTKKYYGKTKKYRYNTSRFCDLVKLTVSVWMFHFSTCCSSKKSSFSERIHREDYRLSVFIHMTQWWWDGTDVRDHHRIDCRDYDWHWGEKNSPGKHLFHPTVRLSAAWRRHRAHGEQHVRRHFYTWLLKYENGMSYSGDKPTKKGQLKLIVI